MNPIQQDTAVQVKKKMQYTNAVTTSTETVARKTNPCLLNSGNLGLISS